MSETSQAPTTETWVEGTGHNNVIAKGKKTKVSAGYAEALINQGAAVKADAPTHEPVEESKTEEPAGETGTEALPIGEETTAPAETV